MQNLNFHKIDSDVNGNPRYIVDASNLLKDDESCILTSVHRYEIAVKRANSIGGRRFDRKSYRRGIVFQSYSIDETAADISRVTGRQFKAIRAS